MEVKPKDKALIDALVDVTERERSARAWRFWIFVAVASAIAANVSTYDALPWFIRLALALLAGLGILLFLVFLSTKPFGRGYYAGPSWWPW